MAKARKSVIFIIALVIVILGGSAYMIVKRQKQSQTDYWKACNESSNSQNENKEESYLDVSTIIEYIPRAYPKDVSGIEEQSDAPLDEHSEAPESKAAPKQKPAPAPAPPPEPSPEPVREVKQVEPEYTVEPEDKIMYTNDASNVRTGPSTKYNKIVCLRKGSKVHVTGVASTGWYQIEYDGQACYICNDLLQDEDPNNSNSSDASPYPTPVPQPDVIEINKPEKELKDFEAILQNPELPTGCEITALAQTLCFYGVQASKTELASNYLPCSPTICSLDQYFYGNPYSKYSYGCYAPVIVKSANDYLHDAGSNLKAISITGTAPEQLYKYIDKGAPVIVWATSNMVESTDRYLGKLPSGEELHWRRGEHCLTLIGYDDSTVTMADPEKGIVKYDKTTFEKRYAELYSQAILIN